jgi:hypothetical protein
MNRRVLVAAVVLLACRAAGAAQPPETAPACDAPPTVHIPIEAVAAPLGVRGESRAQYLDRRYGAGRWQAATEGLITLTPGAESLRLQLPPPAGLRVERIDIVAEAQLDYLDARGGHALRTGHREIGSYPLPPDAASALTVPLAVMRESGALLAIVTVRRAPDFAVAEQRVAEAPVRLPGCERRIYVPDRTTAIRLNRPSR